MLPASTRAQSQTPASTWAQWWRISRPRFWIYCFGPYLVGSLIAAHSTDAWRDWRIWVFAVFFTFPANFFIYGINDIHDWETDTLNGKKTGYETLVSPAQQSSLRRAIVVCLLPFVILTVFTTNLPALAVLALFIFLSWGYSAPPIRAKARPLLDSLFNLLYICPAFFAVWLAGERTILWPYVLAAWCWAMAMHAYSAVPDISADRQAGLHTIATYLGLRATLIFCATLYLCAAILSWSALTWLSGILGTLYAAMMLASLRSNSESGVLRLYKFFPILNTLAGFALFWRIAWSKFF